jgi:hypothetical protein
MLYVFGFNRMGVALSDLYFKSPNPLAKQEGSERGVRLELRLLELGQHEGTPFDSRPINLGLPLWRVDLLESVRNPGSLDRAHHHPHIEGWNTGKRHFDAEFASDPVGWVTKRLEHAQEFLGEDVLIEHELEEADFEELAAATPEIETAIRRLLGRIASGELARVPPDDEEATLIRIGWL